MKRVTCYRKMLVWLVNRFGSGNANNEQNTAHTRDMWIWCNGETHIQIWLGLTNSLILDKNDSQNLSLIPNPSGPRQLCSRGDNNGRSDDTRVHTFYSCAHTHKEIQLTYCRTNTMAMQLMCLVGASMQPAKRGDKSGLLLLMFSIFFFLLICTN